MAERMLRRREVEERTGLGRSALYDFMAKGRFPRPVKLGLRAVAWPESVVTHWIEARIQSAQSESEGAR